MELYKQAFKKSITDTLVVLGIFTFVELIWEGLEMILLGHTNPNIIDSIIGTILVISLYCNYKHWIDKKE